MIVFLCVIGTIVLIVIAGGVGAEIEENKKRRLAALRGEISVALIKAKKAAAACVEMQKAAILAQAAYGVASLDSKEWKFSDGPTEKELVAKTKAAAIETVEDLKRLSNEGIKLSMKKSAAYVNFRTYSRLAIAACEECDPQLCQGDCEALEILNKIKGT